MFSPLELPSLFVVSSSFQAALVLEIVYLCVRVRVGVCEYVRALKMVLRDTNTLLLLRPHELTSTW